jgi:hypothetical protein
MVEVFDPASIRDSNSSGKLLSFYNLGRTVYRTFTPTVCVSVVTGIPLVIFVAPKTGVYIAVA